MKNQSMMSQLKRNDEVQWGQQQRLKTEPAEQQNMEVFTERKDFLVQNVKRNEQLSNEETALLNL